MTRQTFAPIVAGFALMIATAACNSSAERPTASTPDPVNGGDTSAVQSPTDLVGAWQLVSLTENGSPTVTVSEPERFTAEFTPDGRVSLRADCNRCAGGYTATSSGLKVSPMACTRAYCSSAPLDMTFTTLVGGATAWTAGKGDLELRGDSGTLLLRK